MVESVDIKKFINEIFVKKGLTAVKNFPQEFADGSKKVCLTFLVRFQQLFNILFDEKIDCKLEKVTLLDQKMLNWNKLNGKPSHSKPSSSNHLLQLLAAAILPREAIHESSGQGQQ
jgi:hypothetical protein